MNEPAQAPSPILETPAADAGPVSAPVVTLKKRRAQPFFAGHPWVFAGAIHQIRTTNGDGTEAAVAELPVGTVVEVRSYDGQFIAWGLWNSVSQIRIRLYCWKHSESPNAALWHSQIRRAVELRRRQFDLDNPQTGCRLIFSEADGLSGLTVDCYGGWLLVQFTSAALYEQRETILDLLNQELQPKGIRLRTEKGMRDAEGLEAADGLLLGEEPPRPLFIEEHGLRFGVDVQEGQKTGFYLDQRDNHHRVAAWCPDRSVLDAFCFSGGFGIHAAAAGAASVTGVDSSEPALRLAAENARLNNVEDRCQYVRSDVRAYLQQAAAEQKQYDVVILDPPRMARTRGGLQRALRGYQKLNEDGLRLVKDGGLLASFSCSGLVSRDDFRRQLAAAARGAGRNLQIIESFSHPPDHPIQLSCPESEYLKGFLCRAD